MDRTIVLKDGRKIGYSEVGQSDGFPILYFHGTPGARIQPIINQFHYKSMNLGLNNRFIVIERPGYGLSDTKIDYSLKDWINDVIEFTNQLELSQFGLLASSGGAPYAISCSYALPNLITKTAIICGLGPIYLPELMNVVSLQTKQLLFAAKNSPDKIEEFTNKVHANPEAYVQSIFSQLSDENKKFISQELLEQYVQLASEGSKTPYGLINDYKIFGLDWNVPFEQIQVPIHFWHSDTDENVKIEHTEYLVEAIPTASMTRLTGVSHFTTSFVSITEVIEYFKS